MRVKVRCTRMLLLSVRLHVQVSVRLCMAGRVVSTAPITKSVIQFPLRNLVYILSSSYIEI